MSTHPMPENFDELLLDYHMGLLDRANQTTLEQALVAKDGLRAKSKQMESVLQPLASWTLPNAPSHLVDSVMQRIEWSGRTIKLDVSRSSLPSGTDTSFTASLMSLREILAIAASIMIIVGVFVPSYYGVRQRSQRTMCEGQLGNIGVGMSNYAADYDDQLPYAGSHPGVSWLLPANTAGLDSHSNTRHPYLLVKYRYTPPKEMTCPGNPDDGTSPADEPGKLDDFRSPNQMTYSWQVPLAPMRQTRIHGQFVITADHTPYIQNGRIKPMNQPAVNSAAHGNNAGQNVLHVDGHAEWQQTPNCGVNHDNIWQAGGITNYNGTERPQDANDSFLVSPR
jgi:hypothetical protein